MFADEMVKGCVLRRAAGL